MKLFLDAQTTLPFWFSRQSDIVLMDKPARPRIEQTPQPDSSAAAYDSLPSWATDGTAKPQLVVPDQAMRSNQRRFSYHVAHAPLPSNAFITYSSSVAIASPEYCFLRLATELPLPSLAKLGCMLCGSFVFDEDGSLVERVCRATTARRLKTFVKKAAGVRGVKKAMRALSWVRDGAASPAEVDAMLLLCLPLQLGGYSFELPELNGRITLSTKAQNMLGYDTCFCDLLWKSPRAALEYNSRAFHSGFEKTSRDEMRRAAIESTVIGITFRCASNMRAILRPAK